MFYRRECCCIKNCMRSKAGMLRPKTARWFSLWSKAVRICQAKCIRSLTARLSAFPITAKRLQRWKLQLLSAKAQDGTDLDGVLVVPKNYDVPKPWPTVVLVHGGPYQRVSCGFDLPFFNWSPWLTSAGYAVLCVNYRGGSSHGEAHAAGLRGAAGTNDYSDTIDLVKAGVANGTIDQDRVGIAGWSYGGYLSYLAVTRDSTFHFQAAICGAGFSDWDLAIMTSDEQLFGAQIAGHAPWEVDRSNTQNRQGSAIWHMQDIKTPVLILHGENDLTVPISQARAFHQGCLYRGVACDLVVYPREGHGMFPPFERAHYIDMLERMKRFYEKHLAIAA